MNVFLRSICILSLFSALALAQEPNWNQFRGPNSTNHSASTGIKKEWSADGPKQLWKIDTVGIGYSTVSFFGDMMFTMGDIDKQCYVFAIDKNTGKEIWKTAIGQGGDGGGNWPGPLGTPSCDGESVFAMSQFGDFVALDMKDGKERWRHDVKSEYNSKKMSGWGYAMSPIIDGDKIIIPIGGDGGFLYAFDKAGKLLWTTTEIKEPAAYTSASVVEIAGVKQYMILSGKTLAGIAPADGKVLWRAEFPGDTAVCSDPVLCGDVVIASCAYRVGTCLYRITKEGDTFKAERMIYDRQIENHHGGIVAVGKHFYFLDNRNLHCIEAESGQRVWQNRSVGKGSITYVDGTLFVRSERGEAPVAMVEASPTGYKELARFNQPADTRSGKNTWAYPVIVDKKLYLRDQGFMLCYELD